MKVHLSETDRRLLDLIQEGIPLCSRPYKKLGEKLEIGEAETIKRLKKLKENRYIRRLGGVFSTRKLGYQSTLIAARVDEGKYYEVAEAINQYPGVTHNYRRNHDFNLWFTLIATTEEEIERILQDIEDLPGIRVLRELPAVRRFKLKVEMKMHEKEDDSTND